jgi:hypothetical protein
MPRGAVCYCELRRILLPRTPVNKDRERIRRKAVRLRPPEIERWT